jgi:hypothetical protein
VTIRDGSLTNHIGEMEQEIPPSATGTGPKKKRATPRYLTRTWIEGSQLILCTNEQQFKRVLKKTGQKDDLFLDDGALAMTHSFKHNNDSLCVVCIPIYNDMDAADVIGLLVHEAVHVWQYHCEYIGETKPGEEQEAYCIQAITTFLFRDYLRQKGIEEDGKTR